MSDRLQSLSPRTRSIWSYIRDGPDAGGTQVHLRLVGMLVWWQTWVFGLIIITSHVVLIQYTPEWQVGDFRYYGYLVGLATAIVLDWVSYDD